MTKKNWFDSFFLTKAWRSYNDGSRETLNGDASSSSLTAKGFRSVRPNLQDKKSPSQVKLNTPSFMLWHLCVHYSWGMAYLGRYPYGTLS